MRAFFRASLFFLMFGGVCMIDIPQRAVAGEPRIVNIYNFVRENDYQLPSSSASCQQEGMATFALIPITGKLVTVLGGSE